MKLTFEIQNEEIKQKITLLRDKCENFTSLFHTWILDLDLDNIVIQS
ncbi:MAG: hypothetical protein NC191_10100 [Muribaculaceae bacterium]|nr:hypothetical protein [Muribaculaceae bacterium]